jgi:signal peptidase I
MNNSDNIIRKSLSSEHFLKITAYGNSMFPIIRNGNQILIQYKDYNKIELGDIIVFKTMNKNISHRVIKKHSDVLITKGDSVFKSDRAVNKEQYVGYVRYIQKKNTRLDLQKKTYTIYANIIRRFPLIVTALIRIFMKIHI